MRFLISLAHFLFICIFTYPVKGELTVDFSLRVLLPVILSAIIIIMLIIVCYCIYKKSTGYEPLLNIDSSIEDSFPTERQGSPNVFISGLEGVRSDQETSSVRKSLNYQERNKITKNNLKPRGLENAQSECYMNSVMQALASSIELIKILNQMNETLSKNVILMTLINLIDGINNTEGAGSVKNNSKLLKDLVLFINWDKSNQQDAYHFLVTLVNGIHNQIKETEVEIDPPLKIEMVYKTIQPNVSEKIQYNIGLSLALCGNYRELPGVELTYLIKKHFEISFIDGDETKTSQLFFYKQIPSILLLHIQANKWDPTTNTMVKPTYYIKYMENMKLVLPVKMKMNDDKPSFEHCEFRLAAVIHHTGSVVNGHYVTYRKFKDSWIRANDTQVSVVKFNPEICPYLQIYEKI